MKTPQNIEEIWNETENCLFILRRNKLISESEVEKVRQRLLKLKLGKSWLAESLKSRKQQRINQNVAAMPNEKS
jgi:predicted nuclease with TOPRIM domain